MKKTITPITEAAQATFRAAYVEAMFFTEEDRIKSDYEEEHGDKDSDEVGMTTDPDVSEEKLGEGVNERITTDCQDFLAKAVNLGLLDPENDTLMSQAGHDFWLTRNGHGCGFWESGRGYTDADGKRLTTLAKEYKETSLYMGDDELLYLE